MCLGVIINLRPLDKREISSLDKWRLDKLIMLGLINLPSYLPFNTVAALEAFSKDGWLCVSYKVTLSEFPNIYIYIYIYIYI